MASKKMSPEHLVQLLESLQGVAEMVKKHQEENGNPPEEIKVPLPSSRGSTAAKATSWTSIVTALVVAVLGYYNGSGANEKAEAAGNLAEEAVKEEKASAAYELILPALKEQRYDIRQLRQECRQDIQSIRDALQELMFRYHPRPTADVVMGVPSAPAAAEGEGETESADEDPECEDGGSCRKKVVREDSLDVTGPPEPESIDRLPTKLNEHPRVRKINEKMQEQVQAQRALF